ncbi:MAG: hypothetical protein HDS68_01955 [Bacteroidales bacterium]|nr:hypothetical protein [Bacteroidales bacterium]
MNDNNNSARHILEAAHRAWVRLAPVRTRRRRYVRYTYGDQWSDPATDSEGNPTTEGALATVGGRRPLTNNLIRRLVKTVVGRYRSLCEEEQSSSAENESRQEWRTMNDIDELDPRTLEEFLISGIAVHHVSRERRQGGAGIWVDAVPPDSFFINAVRDPRCNDMELVGRLTDMSIGELVMRFAGGDRSRAFELRKLYGGLQCAASVFPSDTLCNLSDGEGSFFHASDGRCRVIEVWTLECRERWRCHDPLSATFRLAGKREREITERINRRRRKEGLPAIETRWEMCSAWHCRMLAPDGTVLDEYDSPLQGGMPPFAVKLYPLIDGDVHSLVEDVLDQQRYVNTLITMMDRMMGTAAKGVLLFPIGCKPDNISWKDVASRWADPGGIVPYKSTGGVEPHQVVTPVGDIGARDMLQTQISLFEDVSGVSNALMGKTAGAGVGVERFESEVRNATVAVLDLLRTFRHFVKMRDRLAASL